MYSPNPVVDKLFLKLSVSDIYFLLIFDVNGKLIKSTVFEGVEEMISLSHFSAGTYILHLRNAAGKVYSSIVVKQ